jgi:hypothetical protein
MRRTAAMRPETEGAPKRVPLADKRHFTHKRLERWIRLQQFVYGLPDDYSYAVCVSGGDSSGKPVSRSLVNVGWMSWYGEGVGTDRQHALAVSLLNTTEALSSNSTTVFFHKLNRIISRGLRCFRARPKTAAVGVEEKTETELLAG